MTEQKPLNWTPKTGIGYTAERRSDGGMNLTFTDLSEATLIDWREFALEHLLGSDRLTRNLYDLRSVKDIPEKAVKLAVEVNSDPSTRNIRVAVLVASDMVKEKIIEIVAESAGGGAALRIFTGREEAEAWLSKPLDQIM